MRKKKDTIDTGLLYAASKVEERESEPIPEQESGRIFETNRGQLKLQKHEMILSTKEGDITVPLYQIEAWDSSGGQYRVWYRDGDTDYRLTLKPKQSPTILADDVRNQIHESTFQGYK